MKTLTKVDKNAMKSRWIVADYLPTYENRPIASGVRHGKLASCNESDTFDSLLQKVELVSTLRN